VLAPPPAPALERLIMLVRLRRIIPYVIVFGLSLYLYVVAGRIEFAAPAGRIGPDFWPKAILMLAMAASGYEIVKTLFFASSHELAGVLETIIEDVPPETSAVAGHERKRFPHLLAAGVALTIAYLVLIEVVGFFLCTLLYVAGFIWIGRYRRIGVILATSFIGSLVFVFVFMKIVYVSLPLGREPFSQVSFLLMRLLGIR
jgi:putative tricarboxylic transport membrane protein